MLLFFLLDSSKAKLFPERGSDVTYFCCFIDFGGEPGYLVDRAPDW